MPPTTDDSLLHGCMILWLLMLTLIVYRVEKSVEHLSKERP